MTEQGQGQPEIMDHLRITKHRMSIKGKELAYTVTAGTMVLREERTGNGEKAGESEGHVAQAEIFFIAYTLDDVSHLADRPLTFSFNGGPGSSSVWLHLGVLGPRRVVMSDDGAMLPPPARLVDNEQSLLPETDLVFIDPISTGYSRILKGNKASAYHDYAKDIESVGDFIRLYTTRYRRWESPKYLIGESYGTTRAAGLAGYLQERHSLYLNGMMLVSSVLSFQTLLFNAGNDLPYLLFLPSYAATAWYHKQLAPRYERLSELLREVEAFVMQDYALALLKGDALAEADQQRIAEKLADYTGLSVNYIRSTNLRIHIHRFVKELMRAQRRSVGRLDSRFTGIDRDAAGEFNEYDPSLSGIMGPYGGAINAYVRNELGYENDLPYEVLTDRVHPWNYATWSNQYVEVGETLRKAISINPFLRVHIASGYYDLATPYFATEYTINHLHLDPALRSNISVSYYEAGHMMYIHLPSLAQLHAALSTFIRAEE